MSIEMNNYFRKRRACPACNFAEKTQLLELSYDKSPVMDYLNNWYSYKKIDSQYLEGSNYILSECRSCGLIYHEDILNDASMVKLYNEWIDFEKVSERLKRSLRIEHYSRRAQHLVNIVSYLDMPPGNIDVLDFGMGSGTWCHLSKGLGCNVYGTDISQVRTDHIHDINIITYAKIPEYRFDFINSEQVFEHLPEPLQTLSYLGESLKPNGLIRISVPEGWDIKKRLKMWDWGSFRVCDTSERLKQIMTIWDWEYPKGSGNENSLNAVAPLQHINCFDHSALVEMARKAGLAQAHIPDITRQARGLRQKAKDFVRPYYSLFMSAESKKRGTELFFKRYAGKGGR